MWRDLTERKGGAPRASLLPTSARQHTSESGRPGTAPPTNRGASLCVVSARTDRTRRVAPKTQTRRSAPKTQTRRFASCSRPKRVEFPRLPPHLDERPSEVEEDGGRLAEQQPRARERHDAELAAHEAGGARVIDADERARERTRARARRRRRAASAGGGAARGPSFQRRVVVGRAANARGRGGADVGAGSAHGQGRRSKTRTVRPLAAASIVARVEIRRRRRWRARASRQVEASRQLGSRRAAHAHSFVRSTVRPGGAPTSQPRSQRACAIVGRRGRRLRRHRRDDPLATRFGRNNCSLFGFRCARRALDSAGLTRAGRTRSRRGDAPSTSCVARPPRPDGGRATTAAGLGRTAIRRATERRRRRFVLLVLFGLFRFFVHLQ